MHEITKIKSIKNFVDNSVNEGHHLMVRCGFIWSLTKVNYKCYNIFVVLKDKWFLVLIQRHPTSCEDIANLDKIDFLLIAS